MRDNIEAVLAMEIPTRLEKVLDTWLDVGQHVAPTAVRMAQRNFRRPEKLSDLFSAETWKRIERALERGDATELGVTLSEVEESLETNLRLRMNARTEYREPTSELRHQGAVDRFFKEAHELLVQRNPRALDRFREIHRHRSNYTIAKEWYAYALMQFGRSTDIHDIIELLEEAIRSEYFRPEIGWTARWNLACALRKLPNRANESLDVLLPVLDNDFHISDAFELCLLWALEQHREKELDTLLLRSPHHEAHLLSALYDTRRYSQSEDPTRFQYHFRRINRILRDRDRTFFDPDERLKESELDELTEGFIDNSLIAAGVEWFRQRLANDRERGIYKNWECAAKLNEEAEDLTAAWRCRQQQWHRMRNIRNVDPARKKAALRFVLTWAERNGFKDGGLRLLRESWQKTGMTVREVDALRLLSAVEFKHRDVPPEATSAIHEMIRLSSVFHRGVDEGHSQTLATQMREQIEKLRKHRAHIPFELSGLVESCERVALNMAVRVHAVPEPSITPPADLKVALDEPAPGETYLTRICARLANPAEEDMRNLIVAFTSTSPHLQFITPDIPIPRLAAQDSYIAECAVHVTDRVGESADIRVFASYEIGGVKRSLQSGGRISVQPVGEQIPTTVRFMTDKPVTADRKDLFHGRDRELKDMVAAFAGGEMRKLYFVNGIRRVGKSSLINHLGASCGPDVLPLVLNVEQALGGTSMAPVQLVRQLIRRCIELIETTPDLPPVSLTLPTATDFELDPPWTVFDDFLRKVRQQTNRRNVLLCFDEMQRLVARIADTEDAMDESFLSWLRGKIQSSTGVLIVCTGSEPYDIMRDRLKQHTIWGNMEPYNVSFVDKEAMKKIATLPVKPDGVTWLTESLERLWDMTEGHPWVIQVLVEKACEHLNAERRRIVMPGDVDAAAEEVLMTDLRVSELWWNESDGLITKEHRQVAFLILQNQEARRRGILETTLGEICQRAGLRKVGTHLDQMNALEVLGSAMEGTDRRWCIRGLFLEKYLTMLEQRERTGKTTAPLATAQDRPVALMLDWENVKIGLSKYLDGQPMAKAQELRTRLATVELAKRLHDAAARHGKPRQRWAVANWDKPFFVGDQASLKKQIRYETDMSGADKANASDHVLRERIHDVLREHPEIDMYVIGTGDGDFVEVIRTLQGQGKRVVLWSTRDAINTEYKYLLSGSDPLLIEWLEDIVFGSEASI
ncbi:MAG: NYN domain-containing protein [candidate division NC10 bacterium]|nr:NYN domain-containing protein [candidate division NC10 bacterium]